MTTIDYSQLAASVLQRKAEGLPRESTLARERRIAVVAQAMEHSLRRRRRLRQWLMSLCTAAAVFVIGAIVAHGYRRDAQPRSAHACIPVDGTCVNSHGKATEAVADVGHVGGQQVVPGNVLRSGHAGPQLVHFDSGTQVELGTDSTLVYDEGSALHRFSISRGSARFKVAKLRKHERFLLNTLDAEVEVRGTVFSVRVINPSSGCGHQTAVSVDEGVVEVRTAAAVHTLHAGEQWPNDCNKVGVSGTKAEPPKAPSTARNRRHSAPVAVDAPDSLARTPGEDPAIFPQPESVETQSALAAQNDLYARASNESKLGHSAQALALFEELISRYPSSALVESALVQRLRMLERMNPGQAKAEAQRYLARFPHGFARAEARELLGYP